MHYYINVLVVNTIAYLLAFAGVLSLQPSPFSFASKMNSFHSLTTIKGGCSYFGFRTRLFLYESLTTLRCLEAFCNNFLWSKMLLPNSCPISLMSSSFNFLSWKFHLLRKNTKLLDIASKRRGSNERKNVAPINDMKKKIMG